MSEWAPGEEVIGHLRTEALFLTEILLHSRYPLRIESNLGRYESNKLLYIRRLR